MIAFASNSLLCKEALKASDIDPITFTLVRVLSGAITLWLLVRFKTGKSAIAGNWYSAASLLLYAAGFSIAYLDLTAGMGALLLFGAVQATMIGYGLVKGERLTKYQTLGTVLALAGFVGLFLPITEMPPIKGVVLMLLAGFGWGVYSILGKGAGDPTETTAGNFVRAVPMTLVLSLIFYSDFSYDSKGLTLAIISGAITSGLGYAAWYAVLKGINATTAATLQLCVPVIAAAGGILLLGEDLTTRFALATIAILAGIALVILNKRKTS